MIKAIIFDFDGVILESATIKTDAFAEVVQDYPRDQAEAFVQYHMSHMGISRHVKFRYFIEEILHEAYSDEKEQVLADKFSYIVFDKVMCCNYVPGAREFLEQNYRKYDFYIATGTPIMMGRGNTADSRWAEPKGFFQRSLWNAQQKGRYCSEYFGGKSLFSTRGYFCRRCRDGFESSESKRHTFCWQKYFGESAGVSKGCE